MLFDREILFCILFEHYLDIFITCFLIVYTHLQWWLKICVMRVIWWQIRNLLSTQLIVKLILYTQNIQSQYLYRLFIYQAIVEMWSQMQQQWFNLAASCNSMSCSIINRAITQMESHMKYFAYISCYMLLTGH